MTILLRPYQKDALDAIWQYFNSGKTGNPVIAHPTGIGKSILPAIFIKAVMDVWPTQRFLLLTHVKELIEQNADVLFKVWPNVPLGIYSAGLKQKNYAQPVCYAGIQSAIKNPALFGWRDIIFIDECFDGETEVLTEKGFIRFDELGNELIAQVGNEFVVSFVEGKKVIKDHPQSPMLKIQTQKIFDVHATANHNMIIKGLSGDWKYCTVSDVVSANYVKMATSGYGGGIETELSYHEKLAIAFQADGSLHKENNDGTAILAFSFSKQRKIDKFIELMKDGGFDWKHLDTREAVGNVKERYRYMVYVDKAFNKDVSVYFDIAKLSAAKAKLIIEYMNIWDGHVASKNCYLYTTTNKKCADFYQSVCALSGYMSNLVKVEDNRAETFSDVYRLFITKKQTVQTQKWKTEKSDYNGKVYCVNVPYGAIITRRGGKTLVTGNCHLINQDEASQYLTFIATMKLINPHVKVIGMTATPFRMGQGLITNGGLFTDIVHDLCSMDNFNKLITDGYLSPLIPLRTKVALDVSNVGMAKGEFIQGQLQHAVDVAEVTFEALREVVEAGHDRRSWLIFASGIEHAEHIAQMLGSFGIDCAAVHSKNNSELNDKAIRAFKNFSLRSIVNYGKLTTGFNHPEIDLIADLRPTMSVPLHVQKMGRGTRPAPGKKNCLALDYGRNTLRLGAINDPIIPRKKGEGTGEVPIKLCNACGVFNHIKAKTCIQCGNEFQFEIKITKTSGTHELIKSDLPIIEEFSVDRAIYSKGQKDGKPPYIKVTYFCGLRSFNEWIFPQMTSGPGRHKFHQWWRQRHTAAPPATTDDALKYIAHLKVPKLIKVWVNKRFPEVMGCEF